MSKFEGRPLVYLASPYTIHPGGPEEAFQDACFATAYLIGELGMVVYSPIAHSHPLEHEGGLKLEHGEWLDFDREIIRRCDELIVFCSIPNWTESKGIAQEIAWFREAGKLISYLHWDADDAAEIHWRLDRTEAPEVPGWAYA